MTIIYSMEYNGDGVNDGRNGPVNGPVNTLTNSLIQVYVIVKDNPGLNTKQIANLLKRPYTTVKKQVSVLQKRDLIEHRGAAKTGGYYVK